MAAFKMRTLAWVPLLLLVVLGCLAEEDKQTVRLNPQMAVAMPADWEALEVVPEAEADGILHIAQSPDGRMTLLVQQKPMEPGDGLAAWAARASQGENVSMGKRMNVGGTEFLTSAEIFTDGATTFTYRLASSVHDGRWIHLILVDCAGQGEGIVEEVAESFRFFSADEP